MTLRNEEMEPYDGPYKIFDGIPRHFALMVNGCKNVISLDRLKLGVIDKLIPSTDCPPPIQSTEATPSESQKI